MPVDKMPEFIGGQTRFRNYFPAFRFYDSQKRKQIFLICFLTYNSPKTKMNPQFMDFCSKVNNMTHVISRPPSKKGLFFIQTRIKREPYPIHVTLQLKKVLLI